MNIKQLAAAMLVSASASASAQQIEVTITNLTHGIYYTPFLVAAHDENTHVFQTGQPASPELQAQAEGGDFSGLATLLSDGGALLIENPAGGLLPPGASTTASLDTMTNEYLSITSMLLPTNDGFVGLDAWQIPTMPGTYTINLNAYDAGTEANDEIINGGGAPGVPGIPVAPGMDSGVNATGVTSMETNTNVHIHRGALGDDDATGGTSDLDNRVHRWLNPVARVTVVVQ